MKRRYRFGGACLTAFILGCGGGSSSAPPTVADFCAQLAQAECAVNCTSATPEPCQTNRKAACMAFAAAATSDGVRMFTPNNRGDCINKSRSAYSSTNPISPQTLADIDLACNYVFQGKKMVLTDSCTNQFQCAGATNGSIICDKGFCAMKSSPKAAGQPCGNPGDVCATGNYCAMNSSNLFVCMAKVASGGACDASKPCVEALRCANGTCSDRVAKGETCTSDADCTTSAPYCNPYASSICDVGLSFASGSPSCDAFTNPGGAAGSGGGGTGGAGGSGGHAGGSGGASGGAGGGAAGAGGGSAGTGGGGAGAGGSAAAGSGGSNQDAAASG